MNQFPDHKYLKECLRLIELQLDWGSSDLWHSEVFSELSELIEDKTKVLLSPITLKRIWGKVKYSGVPSITTLNTLTQFIGFKNWRDFKNNTELNIEADRLSNGSSLPVKRGLLFLVLIFLTSAGLFLIFKTYLKTAPLNPEDITFKSTVLAKGLPNSVLFDLDFKDIQSDSIYIQQYFDPRTRFKVKASQKQATRIYYYPGNFKAKLLIDGSIIHENDIFIKSEGWIGIIKYKPIPKYVEQQNLINGKLVLPDSIREEIMLSDIPVESSYNYVDDFGNALADNLTINASLRHTFDDKWAICQKSTIVVLGTNGVLFIPFSIPGCVSEIALQLNNVYLSGSEHDLSAFGANVSTLKDVQIRVEKKQVSVSLDQKEIYSGHYDRLIGKLVGIQFRFLGFGEVGYVKLRDSQNDSLILNNDFLERKK